MGSVMGEFSSPIRPHSLGREGKDDAPEWMPLPSRMYIARYQWRFPVPLFVPRKPNSPSPRKEIRSPFSNFSCPNSLHCFSRSKLWVAQQARIVLHTTNTPTDQPPRQILTVLPWTVPFPCSQNSSIRTHSSARSFVGASSGHRLRRLRPPHRRA
jgi:hypothetical protein